MSNARVIDTTRLPMRSAADERQSRLAFRTRLYRTATSNTSDGDLPWGADVDVISRGVKRARLTTADGRTGYVLNEHVVDLRYVGTGGGGTPAFTTTLWRDPASSGSKNRIYELLWGDEVQLVHVPPANGRVSVRARGWWGWIEESALARDPLLEVYFVDVGQGDGVLIRTPEGRHVLIDGGYSRAKQPLGKSAADFVDWKFFKDYGRTRITLDAMIASHCDADHYGGLWDLLSDAPSAASELDSDGCDVGVLYHAGVSWWRDGGQRGLGPKQNGHLTRLLGDRASVLAAVQPGASPQLQGEWREFLERAAAVAPVIERLGVMAGDANPVHVPGYGPADGSVTLRVLAPVFRQLPTGLGVRSLGSADSQNTNGHSVLLQLRYGAATILLTGDLNRKAQRALLEEYVGREDLFACDVAKGCHHGAEDVSLRFLRAVRAAATVISSGDAEGHAHPRPAIVAASALTGFEEVAASGDELITPLVYSTEVERSVAHGRITRIETTGYPHEQAQIDLRLYARLASELDPQFRADAIAKKDARSRVHYAETAAGALNPQARDRSLMGSYVVSGIVYGLVNVRSDARRILCATRNETKNGWNLKVFGSRF
jgi:beta-lactamase superfamily II metal-dependent hydrolase